MFGTIDRFEGKYVVIELENREVINIHISKVPKDAIEGDIINIVDDKIYIDREKTKELKKEIKKLTEDMWESP